MLRNICIIFLYLTKTIKDKIILHKSLPSVLCGPKRKQVVVPNISQLSSTNHKP